MNEFYTPRRQSPVAVLFILLKYGRRLVRLVLPLAILYFFRRGDGGGGYTYLLYLAGFLAVYQMIMALLEYFRFYYHIEGDELVIERGVFSKKRISIPFERIQGVNFEQNILHRLLNSVQFKVDTAGSEAQEVAIEALSEENASVLRDLILRNKKEVVATSAEEQVEEKVEKVIFQVDVPTLLKIGVTANHIQTMGIILGFLWGTYSFAEEIFQFGPDDIVNAFWAYVGYSAIVFGIWVFASIILSLVRTVVTYYNLRFWQYEAGFKWISGLFTRQENSAPYNKVQLIQWRTNPLRQLLGLFSLKLFVASSGRRTANELPGSTIEHIEAVQKTLYPESWLAFDQVHAISKRVIGRRFLYFGLIPFLIITPLLYLRFEWWSLMFVLYLPLMYWAANRYQQRWKYWINAHMIKTYSGVIGTRESILPIYKVQAVSYRQSPYQRRKDLVSLVLSTAGGTLQIPYLEKEVADELRDYILYRVERDQKNWM
ncbi:MAG: PH domain-containing protein [Bacteroidota bacterium]